MDAVMSGLDSSLKSLPGGSVALFGHSMGALLAFECAHVLQLANRPPALLIVAGFPAPELAGTESIQGYSRSQMKGYLAKLGGSPLEALANDELIDLMLPILRCDFGIIESRSTHRSRLDCPILALGGREDPEVTAPGLDGWCSHTTRWFRRELVAGGHFFTRDSEELVLAIINDELAFHGLGGTRKAGHDLRVEKPLDGNGR
jgi:surfactin synthase thioesterase subunit